MYQLQHDQKPKIQLPLQRQRYYEYGFLHLKSKILTEVFILILELLSLDIQQILFELSDRNLLPSDQEGNSSD